MLFKVLNNSLFGAVKRSILTQELDYTQLAPHQQNVINRFSPDTCQDGLLVFHTMGSGKSRTAMAVAMQFLNSKTVKRVFVLTPVNQSFSTTQYHHQLETLGGQDLTQQITFTSPYHFCKEFKELQKLYTKGVALQYFENSLFIIDEAHHLHPSTDGHSLFVYTILNDIFHSLTSRRILLLTGTPIRDKPYEIASLMNLLLPKRACVTGDDFINTYFDDQMMLKPEGEETLRNLWSNYVSYESQPHSTLKLFMGEIEFPLIRTKVVTHVMSKIQTEAYRKALHDDTVDVDKEEQLISIIKGLYPYSRQASIICDDYLQFGQRLDIERCKQMFLNGQLYDISATYAFIVNTITSFPDQPVFIYTSYVKMGGTNFIVWVLRQLLGKDMVECITGDTDRITLKRIVAKFNSPTNIHGKKLRVLIGSRVVSEGLSLRNVQQVHIVTPHWNMTEIEQAISRSIRMDSETQHVFVYLHVTIPNMEYLNIIPESTNLSFCKMSVQLLMYFYAEKKQLAANEIYRVLKSCDPRYDYEYEYTPLTPLTPISEHFGDREGLVDTVSPLQISPSQLLQSLPHTLKTETEIDMAVEISRTMTQIPNSSNSSIQLFPTIVDMNTDKPKLISCVDVTSDFPINDNRYQMNGGSKTIVKSTLSRRDDYMDALTNIFIHGKRDMNQLKICESVEPLIITLNDVTYFFSIKDYYYSVQTNTWDTGNSMSQEVFKTKVLPKLSKSVVKDFCFVMDMNTYQIFVRVYDKWFSNTRGQLLTNRTRTWLIENVLYPCKYIDKTNIRLLDKQGVMNASIDAMKSIKRYFECY